MAYLFCSSSVPAQRRVTHKIGLDHQDPLDPQIQVRT